MDLKQCAGLLARISVVDNRKVDEATVLGWHELVGDLGYDDACAAVSQHRRSSHDYLTPKHVRDGVKQLRAKRLEGVDDIDPPPEVAEAGVRAYLDWKRQLIRDVADGTYVPRAAPAVTGRPMPKEFGRNLRKPDDLPPVPGERD